MARHEAMWRVAKKMPLSLAQIGRVFGRDHSTVIAGIAKHNLRRAGGEV